MIANAAPSKKTIPLEAACSVILEQVDWCDPDQSIMGTVAMELLRAYSVKWHGDGWQAVHVEHTQQAPVINPKTGRLSRSFTHAGKIDGTVEGHGTHVLIEHKTTTSQIGDESPYWGRLAIDHQISKYLVQCQQHGLHLAGCLYDVVRKPTTRPKLITTQQAREAASLGTYLGKAVDPECQAAIVEQAKSGRPRETLAMFAVRVRQIIEADSDSFLARRLIYRVDVELAEYMAEMWAAGQDILAERKRGLWPRNTHACWNWATPCAFLGICSGHDDIESDHWQRKENVHIELSGEIETRQCGTDVLTNSSMNTWLECRRKYFFKYETGLQKFDERRNDALFFGSLWHLAMESWWRVTMEG